MSTSQFSRIFRQSPGIGILLYATLIVLLLTLMPFRFQWPTNLNWLMLSSWSDLLLNVALFLPIGFLFRVAVPLSFIQALFWATLYGCFLSVCIETIQLFLPARFSTTSDVMTNTLGALLGSVVYDIFKANLSQHPLTRMVAIEYPLMFDVYLLTFLLWLNGSDLHHEASRLYLSPLLAIFGARVFGSVLAYQSIHKNTWRAARDAIIAVSAWMCLANVPAAIKHPEFVAVLIVASGLVAAMQLVWIRRNELTERRFELETLKPLIPLYLGYLFALMIWPFDFDGFQWRVDFYWDYIGFNQRGMQFYFVQLFVAFTLFGFVVAEFYGRRFTQVPVKRYTVWLTSVLSIIVLLEGFHVQHHVALKELLVIALGYVLGLLLYGQQREIICRKCLSPKVD